MIPVHVYHIVYSKYSHCVTFSERTEVYTFSEKDTHFPEEESCDGYYHPIKRPLCGFTN